MTDTERPTVLQAMIAAEPDSVVATITDENNEELCSHSSSSLHWLKIDLTNRSSMVSKLLLSLYPNGYALECLVKRGEQASPLATIHVEPLPEPDRVKREGAGRTLGAASTASSKKLLRTFPFLIASQGVGVVKVQGLILVSSTLDLVFGFVGRSEGRCRLWLRFPELMEGGMRAPTRTIAFGARGAHVVYASDEFSNPIDANRRAELYARNFVDAISKLSKGAV